MADQVEQLGNYRLIRLLGQGSFADVYLGEHVYLKTQVAIKVLQMRLGIDELEQFLNEARTVARLVHPHIIRVLEFGVEDSIPFLVMDYAPNGTLRQHHPKGIPLPSDSVIQYVKQVAAALQHAHTSKLIHRDVKPENMLLGPNNDILLSDFGLALAAQSSRSQSIQEVTAGTVAYMAPEQLQGKPRPASDQYSLGIVAYEWLSGGRPFQGSFTEVVSQHMIAPPPSLHEKVPNIPSALEQVVMKALAKDPHERFASVEMFATALEQACLIAPYHRPTPVATTPLPQLPSEPSVGTPSFNQPLRLAVPGQSSPSTFMLPSRSTTLALADQADQPPVIAPPQESTDDKDTLLYNEPYKKKVSRRAVIVGLAGLGGLAVLGGAIAFVQYIQPSSLSLSSTLTPTEIPTEPLISIPNQIGRAKPRPTQTPKATPAPTEVPTQTNSAKPRPTRTPKATPEGTPTPTETPVSSGRRTIHSNMSFDFDQGVEVSGGGDVHWNLQNEPTRTLDPVGNAQLANIGGTNFEQIDLPTLQSLSYSSTPLAGNDDPSNQLVDGAVFAVATNGGNHAKVVVSSYGSDLEIRWVTYQG